MGPEAPPVDEGGGDSAELTVEQAVELAFGMQRNGLLEAAEELYRRILEAAPGHVDALHFLGLACHQQGRSDEGFALIRRALELAPDHADARNNLGNLLLKRGDLPGAEEAYRAVLEARPGHAEAHTNLGTVLRRRGELAAAEASFREALRLDPEHGEAYHQLGSLLQDADRTDEALTAFQRALVLRPYDGDSYRRVGSVLYALGRLDEAVQVYKRWRDLEPDNPLAQHLLAACSGQNVPSRASDAFVATTFDTFANSFDRVLEKLDYRAPALVAAAVGEVLGTPAGLHEVLDAGAGTGLCGPLLRPYARRLVGVDLSARMLEKAAARAVYDVLEASELTAYMRERPACFDLVVSADTLVYFGDLEQVLAAAAVALRPSGHLVFTVERSADEPGGGYRLNPHGRYSHGEAYLRQALEAAALEPVSLSRANLRMENRLPVAGLVITARRP